MKKLITGIAILLLTVLAFTACQKRTSTNSSLNFVKLDNGRLHFSSRTFLSKTLEKFKKSGSDYAAKEMSKFYSKDFYSLRPMIDHENESLMKKYFKRKLALKSSGSKIILDDLEDIIGDDAFAGFVNDKGQLEVGDSIYVYTKRGLFFARITDSSYLHSYLAREVYSNGGQLKSSSNEIISPCEYALSEGGLKTVDSRIMRFIKPVPEGGCYGSGGGTGGENDNTGTGDIETFAKFIQSLPKCASSPGTLDWIFGSSAICISNFDNKHRVKTKFWNQDYLVYKSIGISVKYQAKSWGVWWTTKTDEVGAGIKQAYFEYYLPIPDIRNIMPQLYVYNGKVYNSRAQYISTLSTLYGYSMFKMPFKSSLEVVVNLPFYGIYKNDISANRLNKFFWKTIWDQAKTVLKILDKEMPSDITLVGLSPDRVVVNYVNISKRELNVSKVMTLFDSQGGFGVVLGDGNNGGFAIKNIILPKFYDYKNIKIDIYGAARKGDTWRGSHLIYSD